MGFLLRRRDPDRLEELQTVAMRVVVVEAAHAGEVVVEVGRVASGGKPRGPVIEAAHQESRMRLARRPEVLLDAKV